MASGRATYNWYPDQVEADLGALLRTNLALQKYREISNQLLSAELGSYENKRCLST